MAEPNMGDLGLVESLTQRDLNDEAIDEQTVQGVKAFRSRHQPDTIHSGAFFGAALQDMGHAHWIPLLRRRAWKEDPFVVAATLTWSECGQLVGRFLKPLDCWPWRLGLLASA